MKSTSRSNSMEMQRSSEMNRILIIDSDPAFCEMIADYCEAEGFEVALAYVGNEGVQQAIEGGYDLVLLAVVLPGTNGLDVLQGIRSKLDTPVILLANPAQRKLHAAGLELGADDFVEKSVEPRVLLARIRALIRRTKSHHRDDLRPTPGRMVLGDIELDAGARAVRRNGERLTTDSSRVRPSWKY